MTPITDYYLKFPDKETAETILTELDFIYPCTHSYALDTIGLIEETPAELDEQGEEISSATYIEGWHVNLRLVNSRIPEELLPFVLPSPQSPERTFA